ncbi:MAG: GspH/FimT family protein [Gammaproteobacteria bacterium]|nr:GspH/FimT family protein [Gammaproteobacteria bacterium]
MRNQSGITLIELILVVTIVAAVLGLGIPSFVTMMQNNQRAAAINSLMTVIQTARAEAIKRGGDVVFCSRQSDSTCGGINDWYKGWILFIDDDQDDVDADGDGNKLIDAGEPVISIQQSLPDRLKSNRAKYSFNALGRLMSGGSLTYCDNRGTEESRKVSIGPSGRPRVLDAEDADCT